MGDVSDEYDIIRFMRCAAGQKVLAAVRKELRGRWISDLAFNAHPMGIVIHIHFHDGDPIQVLMPELLLHRIQEEYEEEIEEEYYRDFPERRPSIPCP
jgi:hypothetical protein